jgi:hypothetical protein
MAESAEVPPDAHQQSARWVIWTHQRSMCLTTSFTAKG